MDQRIDVGILGATGVVGERMVRLLDGHPWFRLGEVGASERSVGARLGDVLPASDEGPLPPAAGELVVRPLDGPWRSPLLLSALPGPVAERVEPRLAGEGHLVVSNASAHRMDDDVPLVIPEVNPGHLALLDRQRSRWPGALITNPNCVVGGVALALAPLHRSFEIETAVVTTFQAISGAGRPGPAAGELVDNVLPHIAGEEEKLGPEIRKILGRMEDDAPRPARFPVSATTTRVPVTHGHLAALTLGFERSCTPDDVAAALRDFTGAVTDDHLPTAPAHPLEVLAPDDRPQPRMDRDRGRGMTVTVGRIRPCPVHDVRLMVLSHNLVRGAAGAALLNAELCRARGLLDRFAHPGPDARETAVGSGA